MRFKRSSVLTLALSFLAAGTVFADSIWGSYEGYAKAKIFVNDAEIKFPDGTAPAFVINGSTMIPLRQAADALQAIVKWDDSNKTASIYKPNVSMFVAKDVGSKDYSVQQPFGKVTAGETMNFVVFAQVDNLKTGVSGFQITIEDPSGSVVDSREETLGQTGDSFWYTWPFQVKFEQKGNYKVKFEFEYDGNYAIVAEKLIVSE